jgi:hypothetical protein
MQTFVNISKSEIIGEIAALSHSEDEYLYKEDKYMLPEMRPELKVGYILGLIYYRQMISLLCPKKMQRMRSFLHRLSSLSSHFQDPKIKN